MLYGSGGILNKVGSGTLTLTNPSNSYGGITFLTGGTLLLDMNAGGVLGATPPTFAGGTLAIKGISSGATAQTLGADH